MIDKYLDKRQNNKSLKLLQEEVDPLHRKNRDWDALVKAGILTEEEVEKKKKEEEDKAEEQRKLKQDEQDAKDKEEETGKEEPWFQNRSIHKWNLKITKECSERLEMKRLSKKEKKELYQTVRFVHMSHEELIKLQTDAKYTIAKDQLVEALSYKLNNYENAIKEELKLNNRDYRVNYEPEKMMSVNVSQISDKEKENADYQQWLSTKNAPKDAGAKNKF